MRYRDDFLKMMPGCMPAGWSNIEGRTFVVDESGVHETPSSRIAECDRQLRRAVEDGASAWRINELLDERNSVR